VRSVLGKIMTWRSVKPKHAAPNLRSGLFSSWWGRPTPTDEVSVHSRRWLILAVLCLSVFLALIDNTIVNVALPSISRELRVSTSNLQWIVDAYSLMFAALLLVGGSLGDRYGRKGALQFGLMGFGTFSILAGFSGNIDLLIVARGLMGVAAALIFPATLAILTDVFTDAKERAAAVGIWTAITGLGVALGPITGGLLLERFSWNSVFFATVPIAGIAFVLGTWLLPTSSDPTSPRVDLLGFLLSTTGVAALVYTTIEAPTWGWSDPITIAGYAAAALVLMIFTAWERRVAEPMIDVKLFRNIGFSAASFSIMASFFGLFGFIFLVTQYFQLVHGYSPLSAGVHTLPFAVGLGTSAPAAPILVRGLGTKIVIPAGLFLMAAGFYLASTLEPTTAFFGPVVASMILSAIGLGLVTTACTEAILATLPPSKAGVGSAMNDVARELGGTFGVAVVGAVFASVYGPRLVTMLRHLGLSPAAVAVARQSPAAAIRVAGTESPSLHAATIDAVQSSFVAGLSRGSLLCAGVSVIAGFVAFFVLPRRRPKASHRGQPIRQGLRTESSGAGGAFTQLPPRPTADRGASAP
jgi:EmrB/QacA subfamily drug resistance transporter